MRDFCNAQCRYFCQFVYNTFNDSRTFFIPRFVSRLKECYRPASMCLTTLLEPWYHQRYLSFKTAQTSPMKNSRFVQTRSHCLILYSLCITLSTFFPNCQLIVAHFDWQLNSKFAKYSLKVAKHNPP